MNVVLVRPEQLGDDGSTVVGGSAAEHIRTVLKKQVGDALKIGLLGGRLGEGRIVAVGAEGFTIACTFDRDPPRKSGIVLVLALPRPPVLRRVLQHASTMGVARIVLCNAARVEKSYWSSPALASAAIEEQLLLGLGQAGDCVLPVVEQRPRLRPFVEDELTGHPCRTRWIADPSGTQACPTDVDHAAVLAAAPEGGPAPLAPDPLASARSVPLAPPPPLLPPPTPPPPP